MLASLTDNGSNMMAAFRMQLQAIQGDEEGDEDEEEKMEEQESDLGDESIDFEHRECDQAIAFHSLGRISCFAHTLQLVVTAVLTYHQLASPCTSPFSTTLHALFGKSWIVQV